LPYTKKIAIKDLVKAKMMEAT